MPAFHKQTQSTRPSAVPAAPPHSRGRAHPLLVVLSEPLHCVPSIWSQQSPPAWTPGLSSAPSSCYYAHPRKSLCSAICQNTNSRLHHHGGQGEEGTLLRDRGFQNIGKLDTVCPASCPHRTALPRTLHLPVCGVHRAGAEKF